MLPFRQRVFDTLRRCGASKDRWVKHYRWQSSSENNNKSPSPYVVLNLRTSASKDDIKASFRRLAKQYHPDLNPDNPQKESELKMSQLIDAYNQLMDDDFGGRVGDSRVALACEMYTIDELRMDRLHDVHSIIIQYDEENSTSKDQVSTDSTANFDLSSHSFVLVTAHEDDSVSDLKRQLQSRFMDDWGLSNRRTDRDGIATGWELVTDIDQMVLSYHLFLHSYAIKNNDIIHAVVRRYNEAEREAAACS